MTRTRPLTLVLVALALTAAACSAAPNAAPSSSATPPASVTTTTPAPGPVRVLALGDSFTFGEGVAIEERWPSQLATMLRDQGAEAFVHVIAGTGWTSHRLGRELDRSDVAGPFDLVTIQVGVNDHFYQFGADRLREGIDDLVRTTLPLVDGDPERLMLLSLADWRQTPVGLTFADGWRDLDLGPYNAVLSSTADRLGLRYLDVTTISSRQATDPTLVADDGLHASGALYRLWLDEVIYPAVADVLSWD